MSRAIEQKNMQDDLDSLLEELLKKSGEPMTAAEKDWADEILEGPARRKKKAPTKARK